MTINRLLIVRGGAVGDFIVTLPVIGALRQAFPHAWIEVLGHSSRILLADHPRYADRVTDLESLDVYHLFQLEAKVSSRLQTYLQGFDLIVAYLPTADGIFNQQLKRYCAGHVITWPPHPPAGVHITDHLLRALAPLSLHGFDPTPQVERHAEAMAEAFWQEAGYTASVKQGVVAFHPGSGSPQKLWPLEGWHDVMSWARQAGIDGIVIQGPAEQERHLQATLRQVTRDWPWTDNLSLRELASLLRRCQVVLSHDSGIAHLAAAVGTTTLALFGPTDPQVWGPRSPRTCVLQPAEPQALSLQNLPPEVVIQTLAALLEGTFAWQTTRVPCTIKRLGSD